MITTCVHVFVKPEFIDEFIAATTENHLASIQEAGNLSFDVLQDDKDKTKFVLYEAYVSDEAAALHKETAHYLKWRNTVADWMAQPREGIKYNVICPTTPEQWKL